ncbi:hypothetical protein N2152v2_004238 [Parachlorella kessleri]
MRRSLTRVLATAARQAKVEPQDEEPTALPQGGTGAQSYPHKPESALCSEGRGSRQWRREPRSSGSENTSERASTLYQQLEALSNAGDAVGVRKAFDDVLFPALRQQKAAREAGTADFQFPPALLSPVNWRLYLLALERSNAHPHLIGQRMHLLHSLGVPPQVAGYVALLRRAAEGNLGLLAYQKLLEMRDKGLEPTMACYLSAASACLRSEQPGYAKRIFEMIRSANPPCARPQSVQFGKLCMHAIREFARLSRFQYVFDLMDDLEARGLAVPTFLVTDVMHMAAIEGKTEPLLRCVQRLEAVQQYFKVANPAGGDPLEVARPLKLDEGSLLDVLGVAANKGDAELASATWALLLRSLSLPKCPDYYTTKDEELEEGEDPGLDPTEHLPGAQQEPTGESVQSTAAGTAAESATESPFFTAPTPSASKAQQAEQARHTARLPQIASYQALVHAYANAHAFRPMFEAIRELEQQYPAVPEAVAYYGGLQPAVDALAHSTLLIDDAYYLLEGMANEGQQLTATQLNVVVAACSQVGDMNASRRSAQPQLQRQQGQGQRSRQSAASQRQPGAAGVGLAITRAWRRALQHWEAVSPRLLWARFSGTVNVSVVMAYAPTSQHPAARKQFFTDLGRLVERVPARDMLIVLGDFNSKVGSAKSPADSYGGMLGSHGVGSRNAEGEELLSLCTAHRLRITNTFFQHRAARKLSWCSPLARAAQQQQQRRSPTAGLHCLDYILVRAQWLSSFHDCWVGRSANPGWEVSDHHPVLAKVRLHLKAAAAKRVERPPRPNREALAPRPENEVARHMLGLQVELALSANPPLPDPTAPAPPPPCPPPAQRSFAAAVRLGARTERTLTLLPAPGGMPACPPSLHRTPIAPPLIHRPSPLSHSQFPPLPLPGPSLSPVATAWEALTTVLQTATLDVAPGEQQLQPRQPWVTKQMLALVQRRRAVLVQVRREGGGAASSAASSAAKQQLKRLRHAITRQARRDKQANAERVAAQMEEDYNTGNLHAFYATMKSLGPAGPSQCPPPLKGPNGTALHTGSQRAAGFAEHFKEVLQCGQPVAPEVLQSAAAQPWAAQPGSFAWQPPTEAEVGEAVMGLKHWRAADPAGLWAEQLQAAWEHSPAFRAQLHGIVLLAMQHGVPAVAKQAEGLPFFKKGDPSNPGNYRCIQIISMLRKVMALTLSKQLRALGEQRLLEYQCGFRPQRSCSDQMLILRRMSEMAVSKQQRLYLAFVDLLKAFDSVNRAALWVVLLQSGLPEDLVRVLADLHQDTTCRMRVHSSYSQPFRMEFGVQQGCPLAPFLFNVFMDWVVREALAACPDSGVTLQYGFPGNGALTGPAAAKAARDGSPLRVPLLMLADDIVVLASTAEGLQQFLTALEAACQRWGLIISQSKTELMLVGGAAATACEGCGALQPERSMLICDTCESGWHCGCLDPPLAALPPDGWQCPPCSAAAGHTTAGAAANSAQVAAAQPPPLQQVGQGATASAAGPLPDPQASQPAGASSQSRWRPDIWVGGSLLRWVEKFKYLGSHFTHNIDLNTELGYRRSLGAAVFWRLWGPFFSQRCIKLHTRLTVFKVLVLSVVLYGCESLALTCAQQHRLDVFVKGCMRRMLGLRWRDHISDEELYRRCGQEDKPFDSVVVHWRRRSLRFLGHLGRMPESRLAKCILWATLPEGVGRRGRLANPLLPQVYEEHLKQLDLSGARRQQQDKMNAGGGSRALETFDQYEALGVRPDADAYNAILQGCVESGLLDTLDKVRRLHVLSSHRSGVVPKTQVVQVLAEMQSQGVAPNAHTHSLVVERGIVSGDVAGMMGALRQMEAAGHEPKTRLLERCVARCERAGDRENMKLLLERLFRNEYRIVGMDAMVKRWQSEGGVVTLTGSSKWINREEVVQEVQNSHGRYIQLPWQRQREQQQLDVQREGRRPRQQQQQQQYGQRDGGPGRRYQRQERQQAQREGPQRRQQREQRDGYGQRPEYQQEGEQGRGGRERQQGRYQGQRREYQQQ